MAFCQALVSKRQKFTFSLNEEEVSVLATFEKERDPDPIADLVLSPICGKSRHNQNAASSPSVKMPTKKFSGRVI